MKPPEKIDVTVNWTGFGDIEAPEEKTAVGEPHAQPVLPPREAEIVVEAMAYRAVVDRFRIKSLERQVAQLEMQVASRERLLKVTTEERDLLKQSGEAAIGHLSKIVGFPPKSDSIEVVAAIAVDVHSNALKKKRGRR